MKCLMSVFWTSPASSLPILDSFTQLLFLCLSEGVGELYSFKIFFISVGVGASRNGLLVD